MASFNYTLSYAGIPLLQDQAKVVRMGANAGPPRPEPLDKHQPHVDLIDEVNKLIDEYTYLQDYGLRGDPGRNLMAVARQTIPYNPPTFKVKINDFYYPMGASRWSVFRGLATSTLAKTIIQALTETGAFSTPGASQSTLPTWQAAPFVMQAAAVSPNNPQGAVDNYTITTPMYMLPPRPLAEHGAQFDGLYLITLVDERYYWQSNSDSIQIDQTSTWDSLLQQIALNLNINLNFNIIPPLYGSPEPDTQLWTNEENTAVLFDAIATNIGTTVVRNFDGSYQLWTPVDSFGVVQANLLAMAANYSPSTLLSGFLQPGQTGYPTNPYPARTAGGDLFNSGTGTNLPIGDLSLVRNAVIPANGVDVVFPSYVAGDDPVPHFSNRRYQNQRPSAWYEESYGDSFVVNVPLSSGAGISGGGWPISPNDVLNLGFAVSGNDNNFITSGLVGVPGATHIIHTTAKALFSGEVQLVQG